MRILLVDPEDSPRRGPWSRERWDLLVDLGKSSAFSAGAWTGQYGCPILRLDSCRGGVADLRQVRNIFSEGRNRLIDREGIDWWDLTSLLLVPAALEALALQRIAPEISATAELWATRLSRSARLLAMLLERELQAFGGNGLSRTAARVMHYAGLARRFSPWQIKEIFLDKYDPSYQWRARFSRRKSSFDEPVVLLPSAYGNVSRMAVAYARLLPSQKFLMVATRENGKQFVPQPNVQLRGLVDYAKGDPSVAEATSLLEQWPKFKADMCAALELRLLSQTGALDAIPDWIRDGLSVRDAWCEVIEREPICSVMCGDDSNRYTRLPVILARKRKIPTVDFHHGAFDGGYVLKDLPCDLYMAKNEIERDYLLRVCRLPAEQVVVGAPTQQAVSTRDQGKRTSVILFSEPYDVLGMRSEEVYRELLPPLCQLARENRRDLIIKLHPFESRSQRSKLVTDVLTAEDCELVTVIDGPLSEELIAKAWFGITVESTTVLDCLQNGVACFLSEWLTLSPYEYSQQYARFGVGEVLQNLEQIVDIPRRVVEFHGRAPNPSALWKPADPVLLHQWLTNGLPERAGMRAAR